MRMLAVVAMLLWAACGPSKEERCRAIGETPNIAVGPDDRLWYRKNCLEAELNALRAKLDKPKETTVETKMSFPCAQEWREAQAKGYGRSFLSVACRGELEKAEGATR